MQLINLSKLGPFDLSEVEAHADNHLPFTITNGEVTVEFTKEDFA